MPFRFTPSSSPDLSIFHLTPHSLFYFTPSRILSSSSISHLHAPFATLPLPPSSAPSTHVPIFLPSYTSPPPHPPPVFRFTFCLTSLRHSIKDPDIFFPFRVAACVLSSHQMCVCARVCVTLGKSDHEGPIHVRRKLLVRELDASD